MNQTVQNLKSDLSGILQGTTTNKVTNLNRVIERAARKLLLDCDVPETKRKLELDGIQSGEITTYPVPVDIKGDKVIDLYALNESPRLDIYDNSYSQDFNLASQNSLMNLGGAWQKFSIQYQNGVKVFEIKNQKSTASITLNELNSLTSNGTFSATTMATVSLNAVDYIGTTAGSLEITIPSTGTTGGIQTTSATAVDISSGLTSYRGYFWVYFSNGVSVSNINVNFGLDLGNFYGINITKNNEGNSFQNGWNLCSFYLKDATITGVPGTTTGQYIALTVTQTTGTNNVVRFNQFTAKSGTKTVCEYYSKYLFRDATTKAFQEGITDDTTLINLDTESYNMLVSLTAFYCFQQVNDASQKMNMDFWEKEYKELMIRFLNNYKSEVIKPKKYYYSPFSGGGMWNIR